MPRARKGPGGPKKSLAGKKGSKSGGFGGNKSHESSMSKKSAGGYSKKKGY